MLGWKGNGIWGECPERVEGEAEHMQTGGQGNLTCELKNEGKVHILEGEGVSKACGGSSKQ